VIPESPKALVGDGVLITWAGYIAAHGAEAIVWALTVIILVFRAILLWRQVKAK
jgi:hypothetical protein